jgi:alpha-beta hydrolase superfamily lysophospholipase
MKTPPKIPPAKARLIILPEIHETPWMYKEWEKILCGNDISLAEYRYAGFASGRNAKTSFNDVVAHLASFIDSVKTDNVKIFMLGFGTGALIGYAALKKAKCPPLAFAMITPRLPAFYGRNSFRSVAEVWYHVRVHVAHTLGWFAPALTSANHPLYANVALQQLRDYTRFLHSAPSRLAVDLMHGIPLSVDRCMHTNTLVMACKRDLLTPYTSVSHFAEAVGAETSVVEAELPPLLWDASVQERRAMEIGGFFKRSLVQRPYLRLVSNNRTKAA